MHSTRLCRSGINDAQRSVNVANRTRYPKICREHSHDGVGIPAQRYRLTDDVGISAELASPEAVAQNDCAGSAEAIVVRAEQAAQTWLRAQGLEEVSIAVDGEHLNRLGAAGEVEALHGGGAQCLERLGLLLDVVKIGERLV